MPRWRCILMFETRFSTLSYFCARPKKRLSQGRQLSGIAGLAARESMFEPAQLGKLVCEASEYRRTIPRPWSHQGGSLAGPVLDTPVGNRRARNLMPSLRRVILIGLAGWCSSASKRSLIVGIPLIVPEPLAAEIAAVAHGKGMRNRRWFSRPLNRSRKRMRPYGLGRRWT